MSRSPSMLRPSSEGVGLRDSSLRGRGCGSSPSLLTRRDSLSLRSCAETGGRVERDCTSSSLSPVGLSTRRHVSGDMQRWVCLYCPRDFMLTGFACRSRQSKGLEYGGSSPSLDWTTSWIRAYPGLSRLSELSSAITAAIWMSLSLHISSRVA